MTEHSAASMDDLQTWDVLVGRVVGRWDRADLKLAPYSEVPGRFAAGAKVCIESGGKRRLLEIRASRKSGHSIIADCGIVTTEEADALRGAELFIHPSMRPALPPGEFYLDEILGMRVRTEAGDDLGEIEEVLETPAHNVYVTPSAMIPAHADFIVSTDWEKRELVVRDLPGLRIDDSAA